MSDLTEFLLARIAETERDAKADMDGNAVALEPAERDVVLWAQYALAECEAKRRIVELSWHHFGEGDYAWGMEEAKCQILAIVALPYADHPDYREGWKP